MPAPPSPRARSGFGMRGRAGVAILALLASMAAAFLLSLVLNEDTFVRPWSTRLWLGAAGILVLLGAAAAGGWIAFATRLARPFERLAGAARRMTGGATLVQIGPGYAPGEIGAVERAFDAMVETVVHQKAEIEEARRILDDAVSNLGEGVVLFDAEDRLVFCNERCLELFQPIRELMVPGARIDDLAKAHVERSAGKESPEARAERLTKSSPASGRARRTRSSSMMDGGCAVRIAPPRTAGRYAPSPT